MTSSGPTARYAAPPHGLNASTLRPNQPHCSASRPNLLVVSRGCDPPSPGTQTVIVHVPQLPDYEIVVAETLSITLPASATASQAETFTSPDLVILPFSGSAHLSGYLYNTTVPNVQHPDLSTDGSVTEEAVNARPHELFVHLTHNTYVAALGNHTPDDAAVSDANAARDRISRDVLDGIAGAQTHSRAWSNELARLDAALYVRRLDDATLRVELPALPAFDIATPETVTVTLPGSALVAQEAVVAGSFVVVADPGLVSAEGSLTTAGAAYVLKARQTELVLTLTNDTWLDSVVDDPAVSYASTPPSQVVMPRPAGAYGSCPSSLAAGTRSSARSTPPAAARRPAGTTSSSRRSARAPCASSRRRASCCRCRKTAATTSSRPRRCASPSPCAALRRPGGPSRSLAQRIGYLPSALPHHILTCCSHVARAHHALWNRARRC